MLTIVAFLFARIIRIRGSKSSYRSLALDRDEGLVIFDIEKCLGRIYDAPDHDSGYLDRIPIGIVNFQLVTERKSNFKPAPERAAVRRERSVL